MTITSLYKNDIFEWIDIVDLKQENIKEISEKYSINHLLLEDCIDPNHLPKYEDLGDLKFILARQNTSTERLNLNTIADVSTKVGIFLKDHLLLTIHRIENTGIQEVGEKLRKNNYKDANPYVTAQKIALKILDTFEVENQSLLEQMDKMENEIFLKNVENSAQIKRLYRFKRKVGLNNKVLNLSKDWINFFEKLPIEKVDFQNLKDSYQDAISDFGHIETQTTSMISMFLAITDQKANQVMKVLAIYSMYFFPITFIAGVYGMNFHNMPELSQPLGYFIVLGVMILVVILTFIYVRKKRW